MITKKKVRASARTVRIDIVLYSGVKALGMYTTLRKVRVSGHDPLLYASVVACVLTRKRVRR